MRIFWGLLSKGKMQAAFGEFWGLSLIKKGGLFIFLGGFSLIKKMKVSRGRPSLLYVVY